MNIVPVEDIPTEIESFPESLMEVYKTIQQMETLCDKEKGIGLSAVQCGVPWNLFIIDYQRDILRFGHFLDCDYEGEGEKQSSVEGCLSIRNDTGGFRHFEVQRYPKVRVTGKRLVDNGEKLELQDFDQTFDTDSDGIYCAAFQHEIDHQKGILISDIGIEKGYRRLT